MMQHGNISDQDIYIQALQWHLDQGINVALDDIAPSFYKDPALHKPVANAAPSSAAGALKQGGTILPPSPQNGPSQPMMNTQAMVAQARNIALQCETIEQLRTAITEFEGLSIKRTASNLVFSDGNSKAPIMVIGDAPTTDEDRQGKAFKGISGALLDRVFSFIGLSRDAEIAAQSLYMTYILNWRPPGNRTADDHEIAVSLPFIERHIALMDPKIILLAGNMPCKTLLGGKSSIMRLRGKWQSYTPKTANIFDNSAASMRESVPVLPIFHPSYIITNPETKPKMWADMLALQTKLADSIDKAKSEL